MPKKIQFLTFISLMILSWLNTTSVTAKSLDEHFGERPIVIHMGFPGGGFYASAKLAGKYMQKYLPGNPKFLLAPHPGRLGTKVLDFLAQWAPKDGTHLGMPGSLGPWWPLQFETPVKFDPLEMSYIGNVNSAGDTYLLVRSDVGIRTFEDLKSKSLRVSNSRGAYTFFVAALNNILGTNITYVGDYPSHKDAFTAMLTGTSQGVAGSGVTNNAEHRRYFPDLLNSGKAIPILRYTASTKSTEFPNVLLAGQVAATNTQKQALEIVFASQILDRPLIAPPNIKPLYLKALQEAFVKALKDPELIAEAMVTKIGIENPMSGPNMLDYVKRIYALPDAAKAMAKEALLDRSFIEPVRYTSFRAEVMNIKQKGKSPHAVLIFKGKGKKMLTAHLDARTTQLTSSGREILIPPYKIQNISPGMKCEVSWTGPGTTAGKLDCN